MTLEFEKLPRFKHQAMQIVALLPQWSEAHRVDTDAIINQIYFAHAWADSNPKKAPKKLITRFLDSWMKSAKRWNNLTSPESRKKKPAEPEIESDMSFEEMVAIRKRNMRGAA